MSIDMREFSENDTRNLILNGDIIMKYNEQGVNSQCYTQKKSFRL